MYVGSRQLGGRLARAHRLSGVRRGLRGRLGQDDINWGQILTTGIQTAGSVAAIAVKPPTYSSVVLPSGAQSITSYGATVPSTSILGAGTDLTSLLTSPLVLLGGLALLAVFALKR